MTQRLVRFAFCSFTLWTSFASASTQKYSCFGEAVSGVVEIDLSRSPTPKNLFPSYVSRSKFKIDGRTVNLSCSSHLTYFEREILFGRGAWEYDKNVSVFALCGANLKYSNLGDGFHLEVEQDGDVIGYLGRRDHEQGPEDLSHYDFSCTRL